MRIALFFLLSIGCAPLFSQSSTLWQGRVVDAQTRQPLPYVNIGVVGGMEGTVSEPSGAFQLSLKNQTARVRFSTIGYQALTIDLASEYMDSVIALEPEAYLLEAVEIVRSRFDASLATYGLHNGPERGHSVGFGSSQLGTEIGALIPITDSTWITSAHFELNHANRVNMYAYDPATETIGSNLLKDQIIISRPQKPGTLSVDIREYNLVLSAPVLLTLEWIRDDGKGGNQGLTFDVGKDKALPGTFWRMTSQSPLSQLDVKRRYKPCFYLQGKRVR
jgi:hypothetical protein